MIRSLSLNQESGRGIIDIIFFELINLQQFYT